jgi:prolipoprotein diacylglyceryltransferase
MTKLLIIGNVIAFIVALLAIKSFIGFCKKGFSFGYYRIAAGIILLIIHFSFTPDYHLMTDEDYLNGQILLIDKPLNWTLSGGK